MGADAVALILGDNIFYGTTLLERLQRARTREKGATIFCYPVNKPEQYGVIEFDAQGKPASLKESPRTPTPIWQ